MKDITDPDYTQAKRIYKDFEIKNLVEYPDLYVQTDTFLLSAVFKNFQNMCREIYGIDPAHFFLHWD